ncbi:hypothetical protein QF035_009666 [Streptomyces umbrinus]|uniref:Uncharacterized protein n=1 Tax=Streptomyces umbrinus TaxID=67370 RepID=A0ABU0T8E2_9ACTN|nr:hypothetical protein [Streptomyces umbrinus]
MSGARHPLDNPALGSLTGPHAHFAERHGRVLRYPVDVSPWLALPDEPGAEDWADLASLVGPGGEMGLPAFDGGIPDGWEVTFSLDGVQLVDDGLATAPEPEAVPLGPADVPEMLDLVERTRPGPFLPRTVELGTYLGIRRNGTLIAMAGERLHPPGWTEISAVCTPPGLPRRGPRDPADPGGRPRHPRPGRDPVPARRRREHHRHPALRGDGLPAAAQDEVRGGAGARTAR